MERAITPVTMKLLGGEEREFLLSMGAMRRLRKRFEVKDLKDLMALDASESGTAILYESLINRGDMTEEQFADRLPAHYEVVISTVATLLGLSFPERKERPIEPLPTVQ